MDQLLYHSLDCKTWTAPSKVYGEANATHPVTVGGDTATVDLFTGRLTEVLTKSTVALRS